MRRYLTCLVCTKIVFLSQAHVDFVVNASYPAVLDWLSKASIGLSTMVDEHFGINIVEFLVCQPHIVSDDSVAGVLTWL